MNKEVGKNKLRENSKTKIAFVHYGNSTFIEQDYKVLSKHFIVTKVEYKKIGDALKIAKAVLKSDISFSWFADGWTFFAVSFSKLFRKKSIIVVGGYDVACEPKINYGICMKSKLRQWMRRFALNNADTLLPVSNSTKIECLKYLTHPKDLWVVYNGVNTNMFKLDSQKKENIVLTVASGSGSVIKLKGLDTFINCALQLPNVQFIIIGLSADDKSILEHQRTGNNIILLPKSTQEELIVYYQKAKVYCQLSCRESFGMSLVEAMLCGCIPVVTDRAAMPEIVGNIGFTTPYADIETTIETIKKALKSDKSKEIRERIVNNFSLKKRERELMERILKK